MIHGGLGPSPQTVRPVGDPPASRTYLTYTNRDDSVHVMCRECPDWDVILESVWGGEGADGGLGGPPVWLAYSVALSHVRQAHGGQST